MSSMRKREARLGLGAGAATAAAAAAVDRWAGLEAGEGGWRWRGW